MQRRNTIDALLKFPFPKTVQVIEITTGFSYRSYDTLDTFGDDLSDNVYDDDDDDICRKLDAFAERLPRLRSAMIIGEQFIWSYPPSSD